MAYSVKGNFDEGLNQWLFDISGEIDISNAPQLKKDLESAYAQKPADIIVNVSELTYIDSTGLGAIISVYGKMKNAGHRIVLTEPKDNVKKLLNITSLDKVLC